MKIPISALLLTLFVGLKLTGYIDWSWVWVVSPVWIPVCLYILFLVFICLLSIIFGYKITIRKKIK